MRSFYYMSSVFSTAAIPFLANLILAKHLSQDDYALFSLLSAFVSFAGALALVGQPTAFTSVFFSDGRRDFAVRELKRQAVRLIFGGVIFVAILCAVVWFLKMRTIVSLELFVFVFALLVAKTFFDFFNTVVNCLDMYKIYAGAAAFSGSLMFAGLLAMPTVATYFIIGTVVYASAALYLNSRIGRALIADLRPNYPVTANMLLRIGWVAVPGMLVTSGLTFGERSLISQFLDNQELAVYALATTFAVSGARVVVVAIIKSGLILLLGALQNNDTLAVGRLVRQMANLLILSLVVFAAGVKLFADRAFIDFFGPQYEPALRLLIPLFSISVLEGFGTVLSQPLIQKSRLGSLVLIGVTATCLNLFLNYMLIPYWGLNSLIVSFALSTSFGMLAIYIAALKAGSKLKFPFKECGFIIFLNFLVQTYA